MIWHQYLPGPVVRLAKKHDALVFVDECHATGFVGPTGRGSAELEGVLDEVDIINSTLGKALGGASGVGSGRRCPSIAFGIQEMS